MSKPRVTERYRARARRRQAGLGTKEPAKDLRWWLQDEPHRAVWSNVERIGNRTRARRWQDLYFACLYDDAELAALVQGAQAVGEFTPQTMSANVCRRQVDTFVARITKNRPVPMALTTGGNYPQQRRAKSLSKFFEGQLDNIQYWRTRELRLRDAGVFGSGLALNYRVGGKLHHDHMFGFDLRVDSLDARYGNPRTIYLRRFIDRLVAKERWPDHADDIDSADSKTDEDQFETGYDETCDQVLVIEAWHLPSGEGAGDGAHAICISNATLEISEYVRDYFPFSKFDFSPPIVGWFGEGMVKQLAGLQYEVNSIGLRLQEQGYLTGTYVWVPPGAGLETDVLDNGALTLIRSAVQPTFMTPAPWHPQIFEYYQRLRGQYPGDVTGMSGLATRSEKPAGLDSGRALRVYHDIDNENLTVQGRADERDVIDTCWQFLDLAEEIYAEGADAKDEQSAYRVKIESRTHGRSVLQDLSYKDVRLDRETFTLRVFPTSFLASTPEDRWSQIKEVTNSGFLSQDEAMALLDFPDLDRVMNLRGAARRNIERLLEKILDADDPEAAYEYPEPAWNLELCKALALMFYLDAKLDGAPEKNLQWILQFATDAQAELSNASAGSPGGAATAQADAGAPPGPPGEQYAPPPTPPLPANAVAPSAIAPIPGAP